MTSGTRIRVPRVQAELAATLIRGGKFHYKLGVVSSDATFIQPIAFWRTMWHRLRDRGILPAGMAFAAFLAWMLSENYALALPLIGLVTNAGADYQADDFAGGGSTVNTIKYHESGQGTTAAAVGDTDLETKISLARVTGTNSKPGNRQFRTLATIAYNSTYTITEWGGFSGAGAGLPPTGDTLWDRRVFAGGVAVRDVDSIAFQYTATFTSGGS